MCLKAQSTTSPISLNSSTTKLSVPGRRDICYSKYFLLTAFTKNCTSGTQFFTKSDDKKMTLLIQNASTVEIYKHSMRKTICTICISLSKTSMSQSVKCSITTIQSSYRVHTCSPNAFWTSGQHSFKYASLYFGNNVAKLLSSSSPLGLSSLVKAGSFHPSGTVRSSDSSTAIKKKIQKAIIIRRLI